MIGRISYFAHRSLLCLFAVGMTLACVCTVAEAQTAPQLLPYSVKAVAGGGTAGGTGWVAGQTCPTSGNTSTDVYGDGCLATEITLTGPRAAIADASGNIFFADYANGLIRRVDALTGVVTAVAGGVGYAASPAKGAACASGSSLVATDAKGDGCLGTQVYVAAPIALAFSSTGDLYFAEIGTSAGGATFGADVRKIAATNKAITTTGIISMVDGALSSYTNYGYSANNYSATPPCSEGVLTNCIVAATQSYLDAPYSLAFDSDDNLYITEEYKYAVLVVNTTSDTHTLYSGTTNAIVVPAGTVAKVTGALSTTTSTCPNGQGGSAYGCKYSTTFSIGTPANSAMIDYPYGIAVNAEGDVYFANYGGDDVAEIPATGSATAGNIYLYAGEQHIYKAYPAPVTQRGNAGTFAVDYVHGVAIDSNNNVYISDSGSGVIWRVDGAGQIPGQLLQPMYPVAGGASAVCTTSIVPGVTTIDTYGDGCPGTQAKFGTGNTTGVYHLSVDAYSDLFVGDTTIGEIREVASGTQFGPIGANPPTQYVDIHFAAGDGPAASGAYSLAAGSASVFSLGTATCTTNSDTTQDCVLPVTASPSTPGVFSDTLQVVASLGGTAAFPLSGTYVASPYTRTAVAASQAATCSDTTAYNTTTPVILKATITSNGANAPTGAITFYANGTQIGTPQTVSNNIATLTYTFSTAGSYAITATYSGDSYYITSTSSAANITSAVPSLSPTAISYQSSSVAAGQTALYSFNLQQNVYTGTISFSCSGLPANSSCVFSPTSITASGCQTSNTVAMSISTTPASTIIAESLGGGRGPWRALSLLCGVGLALLVGLRRRSLVRAGRFWIVLAVLLAVFGITSCNSVMNTKTSATPAGSYTVTVTVTGSTGTNTSFTVPLTVQ